MRKRQIQRLATGLLLFLCTGAALPLAAQTASFTLDNDHGCGSAPVNATNTSTAGATAYDWYFGEGTGHSSLVNASHVYTKPGTYTVTLTATYPSGVKTATQTVTIYNLPVATFTSSVTEGCSPLTVNFTNKSTAGDGTIAQTIWDFGDKIVDQNNTNATHTFTVDPNDPSNHPNGVTFPVTLVIINSLGCKSAPFSGNTSVHVNVAPLITVTSDLAGACSVPQTIHFSNAAVEDPGVQYSWNYGDGTIDNTGTHTYTKQGDFSVVCTATSAQGCTTVSTAYPVSLHPIEPNFTISNTCTGAMVSFVNTATPTTTGAQWDFGDGSQANGNQVQHPYDKAGTYSVTMTAIGAPGCSSAPITKDITITDPPVIANVETNIGGCSAPFTTSFSANTTGAIKWSWSFGDGNTSTGKAAAHTYTSLGTYPVILTASNAAGCDISMQAYTVTIKYPMAQLGRATGCLPFTTTFNPLITSDDPVTSLTWNFGDGSTGTGASPTHTYTKQGDFDVKLTMRTAAGCVKDTIFTKAVETGAPLIIDFSANPLTACAKEPIAFKNLTTPTPLNDSIIWLWQFGNDGTSSDKDPTHPFLNPGNQTVTLTAINNGCLSNGTKTDIVYIKTPVAIFTAAIDCATPFVVAVQNTSKLDPLGTYTYTWDFGDGTPIVTDKDPAPHTYTKTGSDQIHLSVSDGSCKTDTTLTKIVMDPHPILSANQDTICMLNDIKYTLSNFSSNEIASGRWEVSPGAIYEPGINSYTLQYNVPQEFNAVFNYIDGVGCPHSTASIPIVINGALVNVGVTSTMNCVGKEITFSDGSRSNPNDPITSWRFDWGDDSPSSGKLPTAPVNYAHTFPGENTSFNVTYAITDKAGCGPYGMTLPVNLNQPKADFALGSPYGCPDAPIMLSNTSVDIGNIPRSFTNVDWTFSDGTSASGETPYKTFSHPGTYDITLKVTDAIGCTATKTGTQVITVHNPKAIFSLPDVSQICPPVVANLSNTSTDFQASAWDFGDGATSDIAAPTHVYNRPGSYTISLTVTSLGGCTSQTEETVKVKGPDGNLTMSSLLGCPPMDLTASATNTVNTVKYIYDYDDGTTNQLTTSTDTHTYLRPGVYHPRLLLQDGDGCQVPANGDNEVVVDSIGVQLVMDASQACDGGPVSFTALPKSISQTVLGLPSDITWYFGTTDTDNTATGPSVTHTYGVGDYTATLNVTSGGGCVAKPLLQPVHISPLPVPVIEVIPTLCMGTLYQPVGHDSKNISSATWTWQIKGNTYTNPLPPRILFDQSGTFPVTLSIVNADGSCPASTTANVNVNPLPSITVSPKQAGVCEGSSVQLTASVAPGNTVTWTSYNTSDIHSLHPSVSPEIDTLYAVQVQDPIGCINADSARVSVVHRFQLDAMPAVSVCAGLSTQLMASGADLYSWSPTTGLSNASISNPMTSPATSTVYTVTGKDKTGCFTETAQVNVTVNPVPVIKVISQQEVIAGSSVPILVQASSDVTSVSWFPPDGLSCTDCLTPTVTPTRSGGYTITASNNYGCIDMEQVNFKLVCNGAAFLPNTFTPNGDGMNDVFYIRGKGVRVVKSFRIFNRLGQVMFTRENFPIEDPAFGWDGRYAGQPLSPDVFIYYAELICETGEKFEMKGSIMIVR
ncbi:gliding motility-associated C-terminal domain-containing protein [Chitinophaga costaii]|uniref:Gliding motility-associated C-terminal domain-containing protein n=1 Tax=Chitinophaga costaii TaxID=1335309 RepID=A0A1C4C022_9BACT|nr:PKD domain-containing protein [Chitinophaga costaii]PUZ27399.1 PKD domain-containing protein [Chitinophaga costaii]SCC12408.1 gliding motility-associated C-terminal domain-containing protein [Chitinophaga costaii]